MSPPTVAFFDLDGTLLAQNSGVLFAREAHRSGQLTTSDLLRSLCWAALHRAGRLDVAQAYRRAGALFRGMPAGQLEAQVDRWFGREVAARLRPGARPVLARHRARGDRLVLITNSSAFIARAAVRSWGLDCALANESSVDAAGLLTGEVNGSLCYGVGKLDRAEAWAAQHGSRLAEAWFYSDSIADLPLLSRVGRAEVVHPDRRLRRVARARGWRIHDWSR